MRVLIFLIRNIVYSNLFVSLCITLLAHQTYLLLRLDQSNVDNVLKFIFCSTLFTYNFQRLYRLNTTDLVGKLIGFRLSWIIRNRKKLFLLTIVAACGSFYFLLKLNKINYYLIVPLALLSILHVIPIFKINGHKLAIREFPFIKIFIISIVWMLVLVALPVVDVHGFYQLKVESVYLLMITQFLFIFAITLPFDVRDMGYDKEFKIKTLPMILGLKKTLWLAQSLMVGFMGLKVYQYYLRQIDFSQLVSMGIVGVVVIVLIGFTRRKRPELFYSGLMEGTMILMYLSILVLEYY